MKCRCDLKIMCRTSKLSETTNSALKNTLSQELEEVFSDFRIFNDIPKKRVEHT